jgi:hypothetical protein
VARVGTFDPQLEPRAWFDTQAVPEGWFVEDLLVPAGGAFTLSADGGTYSYSGNNANTLFNRRLVADGGTYTYTGNDANTLFNRRLVADGGVYAYSGNNATLTYTQAGAFVLQADGGVYSYSGNNANLLYSGTPIVVIDTHDGDWKRRRKFQEDEEARAKRRQQIQNAYEVLLEGRPEVVEAIAAPFVDAPKTPGIAIQTPSVNWEALLDDLDAAERLYAAYVELDDEEVLLLL